ncbi:MAG: hypothetical protein ACK4PH_10975 [Aquincola tertiaricarbonis]|uniref:hypothetical protein n=1 Tax=Aquincola TaxID=391952 RepID=UPI0006151BAE|nr:MULTISPECIES: hypothetical protein [Aquincola]MCR5866858.1 hypothetical protein [Aquincola sp. J276]
MTRTIPLQHGLALCLALATTAAAADQGLRVSDAEDTWPRWHARIGINAPSTRTDLSLAAALPRTHGAQVLGDYYFAGTGFEAHRITGGFRATSGLLLGSRSAALSTTAMPSAGGLSFTRSTLDASGEAASTVPYLGVGYTGLSVRGGWGFTADVGLMALGGGLRVGRSLGPSPDDLARDLRLMPVLQLGVSYSF